MHPAFQARLPREHHPPPLTTLIPLALAVGLSLAASAVTAIAFILNTRALRHLVDRITGGETVSSAQLARDLHHHHVVYWIALTTAGVSLIMLIAWSVVAHRNTHPHGPGWWAVIFGWLVPVINLWSPPRMLARTRSAQLRAYPRTATSRAHYELILGWWVLVLVNVGLVSFIVLDEPARIVENSALHERNILTLSLTQASVSLASSVALLAVVTVVTWSNETLRRARRSLDADVPLAPVTPLGLRPRSVSAYPSSIFPVAVHPSDPRWKPEPPDSGPSSGDRGYWT